MGMGSSRRSQDQNRPNPVDVRDDWLWVAKQMLDARFTGSLSANPISYPLKGFKYSFSPAQRQSFCWISLRTAGTMPTDTPKLPRLVFGGRLEPVKVAEELI